jgi:O-acetylhomoserine/O-acetylserine sulfhydrylase-like pyridoxal-dependent enzyme
MNIVALVLVACLPHFGQCKSIVQHPAPRTHEECSERAAKLQNTLAGTIDDAGYQYAAPDLDGE